MTCCDLHGRNCEPPDELCCACCIEAEHPNHSWTECGFSDHRSAVNVDIVRAKPRLLDLMCGGGGCSVGYARAGFDVVGVDNRPMPRYPFKFVQADAMEVLADAEFLAQFEVIHASPPCQAYSISAHYQRSQGTEYPDLVAPTRELLERSGLPWVMENVPGAPIRPDFRICGCTVGLPQIRRERWFETNWSGISLLSPCHHTEDAITVVGHGTPSWSRSKRLGKPNPTMAEKRSAMGIDWMNRGELSQAIPPSYTEHTSAPSCSTTWPPNVRR